MNIKYFYKIYLFLKNVLNQILRVDRKLRPGIECVCEKIFMMALFYFFWSIIWPLLNGLEKLYKNDKVNVIYIITFDNDDNLPNAGIHIQYCIFLNYSMTTIILIKMLLPNEKWFFSCVSDPLQFDYFDNNHKYMIKNFNIRKCLCVKVWYSYLRGRHISSF